MKNFWHSIVVGTVLGGAACTYTHAGWVRTEFHPVRKGSHPTPRLGSTQDWSVHIPLHNGFKVRDDALYRVLGSDLDALKDARINPSLHQTADQGCDGNRDGVVTRAELTTCSLRSGKAFRGTWPHAGCDRIPAVRSLNGKLIGYVDDACMARWLHRPKLNFRMIESGEGQTFLQLTKEN